MYTQISTVRGDKIYVRGLDLTEELMGRVTVTDMISLTILGRLPGAAERRMVDAILVSLVDHGVTPSSLSARLAYFAAPEAAQAAMASGLLASGSRVLGAMEDCARILAEHSPDDPSDEALSTSAAAVVAEFRSRGARIPGIGHTSHRDEDPRATRLLELAADEGYSGRYVALLEAVRAEASAAAGKALTINVTGAIGAVLLELGFPIETARGFGLMSRLVALVAHIAEEAQTGSVGSLLHRLRSESAGEGPEEDPQPGREP